MIHGIIIAGSRSIGIVKLIGGKTTMITRKNDLSDADKRIRIELVPQDDTDGTAERRIVYEEKQISLYELAQKYHTSDDGYEPVCAVVNGVGRNLSFVLDRSSTVRLLDLRSRLARLIYQRSIFFLFLKALDDTIPGARVSLKYPLNGGLFVKMKSEIEQNDAASLVWRLELRMKELVAEKVKFTKHIIRRSEIIEAYDAVKRAAENGLVHTYAPNGWPAEDEIIAVYGSAGKEYAAVLKSITRAQAEFIKGSEIREVFEYTCGEFSAVFYEPLLESAEQLGIFELMPYDGNLIIRLPYGEGAAALTRYRDDTKLYEALRDVSKWQSYVNVRTIADLNNKLESGAWHEFVLINEAMHEKKIAMIADSIVKAGKRIILIAGPTSSGKTTFAQRLCIQLRVNGMRPLYMGTDDYFVERGQAPRDENGKYNFEDLEAVDVELFNNQMNALLAGETVDMPVFDFVTGSKRYGMRITKAEADQPIVIEGIHALNRDLTYHIDDEKKFRIYISPLTTLNIDDKNRIPLTDVRFLRRMARDMRSRNKSVRETIAAWPDVRRGEIKNIFPYNGEADVMFNSALLYELAVLKPLVQEQLQDIKPDEPQYLEAQRLLRLLRCVHSMTDTNDISNNSIMCEFIGGGIWVK